MLLDDGNNIINPDYDSMPFVISAEQATDNIRRNLALTGVSTIHINGVTFPLPYDSAIEKWRNKANLKDGSPIEDAPN